MGRISRKKLLQKSKNTSFAREKTFANGNNFLFFLFSFLSFVSLCFYEPGNVFDQFAIKTVDERGETVGHLPKEISRVTKYFLDRGISMHCKLTSRHYRRSPLVQGGLEIKCEVVINSRATVLQSRLTARYLELIQNLYTEPVEERVMGELVFNFVMTLPPMVNMPVLPTLKKRKKKATTTNATTRNRDIREMFSGSKKSKKTQPANDNIIVLD